MLKDGTQTITQNIPMSSKKLTGLTAGTAATDSVMVSQLQTEATSYAANATVSANTILLTLTPAIAAYTDGMRVSFIANLTNTGSCTVNINSLGANTLFTPDGVTLIAGDIRSGAAVTIMRTASTTWHLMTVAAPVRTNNYTALSAVDGSVLSYRAAATNSFQMSTGLYSTIYGLTYQNNAGDATNDIDIAAGGCMDGTNAYPMTLAALTKRSDATFVVGNAQGMLDTGAVGDSDYYLFAIARADTAVTDFLCSLSSTAPTMPANYGFKRLIGWFKRVGGTIVAFKTYETEGGGLRLLWDTPTLDINSTALTTSRLSSAVKVPLNISTEAIINVCCTDGTASAIRICCPDQADVAPGNSTTAPLANVYLPTSGTAYAQLTIKTSATGTISARSLTASVDQYSVSTEGFIMSRR